MRPQAVFIDLDGTLLNNAHLVTDFTRNTLTFAIRSGVHIVINSGRIVAESQQIFTQIGLKIPFISANGAFLQTHSGSEVKNEVLDTLNVKMIYRLIDFSVGNGACLHLFSKDHIYMSTKTREIFKGIHNEPYRIFVHESDWNTLINEHPHDILKGAFLCCNEQQAAEVYKALLKSGNLEVMYTAKNYIEFNSKKITKGSGMLAYLKKYGISQQNVIAIGDHENDLPMIRKAGIGVAMGNAIDSVKNAADYVTLSNEFDGAAVAIRKYLMPA